MPHPSFVLLDPHLNSILIKLHNESDSQQRIVRAFFILRVVLNKLGLISALSGDYFDWFMRDKSVALDRDKAQLCYLMIRATGAKTVVEVGTSFGVSTIWLAAGVRDNFDDGERGVVIATEREPEKISKAKANWEQAGLTKWIKLLEGDVMETLRNVHLDNPVDLVLMDIWTPLALPSLKNLIPKMRKGEYCYRYLADEGTTIMADNTYATGLYKEYLAYIHEERNGFRTLTMPFNGGLEMSVYVGEPNQGLDPRML